MQNGIAVKRYGRVDERPEIEIRMDAARTDEGGALFEHRHFGRVAADRRDQRELFERLEKGDS